MAADPRGPSRIIGNVTLDPNGGPTLLTLQECGHVVRRVNHFSYRAGERDRCFECQRLADRGPPAERCLACRHGHNEPRAGVCVYCAPESV